MIYILRTSHQLQADRWYFLWKNEAAASPTRITRAEAECLLLCGTFENEQFSPGRVQGLLFKKGGHITNVSAVTHQLDGNTWLANWKNSEIKGSFKITQAEADHLHVTESLTRGEGSSFERWFVKQTIPQGRTQGNISQFQ